MPLHVHLRDADQQGQVVDVELHRGAGNELGDIQRGVVLQVGGNDVVPHQPGDVDAQVPEQTDLDHRADFAGVGVGAEVDVLAPVHRLVQVDIDAIGARGYRAALFEVLELDRRTALVVQKLVVELHGLGSRRQGKPQGHEIG
ncbi:hypothetical protein D3C80_1444150 [compost metagenome]